MSTVVALTILSPGHLYPFLSVLFELRRRGFTVKLYVHNDVTEQVPSTISGVEVKSIHWAAPLPIPVEKGRTAAERVWLENLRRTGEPLAEVLDGLIVAERPDFVLVDPVLWGTMIAAESSGISWGTLSHNPLSIRGHGLDVRGPGLRPPRGWIGRLRHHAADWYLRLSLRTSLELLNALRQRRGLAPVADFRERYIAAPLIIAATAEPFEYPRQDWPRSIVFVGPLFWEPDGEQPPWLEALDDRPLILLAGSTVPEYRISSAWINVVFEAFESQPIQIIATLPTDDVAHGVPANVRIAPFVPHAYLLGRAQCVICHGGFGITAKALAAGVPVVAVPQVLDRFEVARRVQEAGAGVMLNARTLTPSRVRAAVNEAMARRSGARRIAAAFQRAGGPAVAADAVERAVAGEWRHPNHEANSRRSALLQ